MSRVFERSFAAAPEVLADVRTAVRDAVRDAGCAAECAEQLVLAVNEACMNIIQHGYQFAAGAEFRVEIDADGAMLHVRLLDNGRPVGETDLCPRELEDLRPGGLGVRFMREVTDGIAYLPAPAGFANLLEIRKRIG